MYFFIYAFVLTICLFLQKWSIRVIDSIVRNSSQKVVSFFFFVFLDFSIDATSKENLGKYVNDSTSGKNCTMKPVYVEGDLHLCLFVLCDITMKKGMELRYSYGDCKDLFWRRVSLLFMIMTFFFWKNFVL